MVKTITSNQLLGQIGETAVQLRFLTMGFQFDVRSRLEAGIDGIAEIMDKGRPLACMIAVQIKSTERGKYVSEDTAGFTYLLRTEDLDYWSGTNLPIIIVLYRKSDDTYFWKEVQAGPGPIERRLQFDKKADVLDRDAIDRLAALTVPKVGFGYYVPPLGGGEEAVVNMLPVRLPAEMFVATTPHTVAKAKAILLDADQPARFDWVIKGGSFWSFQDPRATDCQLIVDLDQVESIDTSLLAFHEDLDERHSFSFLLKQALDHQVRDHLNWDKKGKLFYFKALAPNEPRVFAYEASKKRAEAEVVNVIENKIDKARVEFVRHHAFVPKFERLYNQWFLVIEPTYFFTTNGFVPHPHPHALLAGKKRLDKSGSLRGQIIMWHRFLTQEEMSSNDLFAPKITETRLFFDEPPTVPLATRVPEDVWGSQKKSSETEAEAEDLLSFE